MGKFTRVLVACADPEMVVTMSEAFPEPMLVTVTVMLLVSPGVRVFSLALKTSCGSLAGEECMSITCEVDALFP